MKAYDLISYLDANELARAVAEAWLEQIDLANARKIPHHVALSGGRISRQFFTSVVEQAARRKTDLSNVEFFWADERCLPPTDPESNFHLAQELLFSPLKVSEAQIHRIRGEDAPEVAARSAAEDLRRSTSTGASGQPVMDLIFLGLGEDGHTASLFPGEPESISASPAIYRPVFDSPKPPPRRVTLGFSTIAAAREVWMLASGAGKETALRESVGPDGTTPFARVLRNREKTRIFTDIPGNF